MHILDYNNLKTKYLYIWFVLTILELNRLIGYYFLRPVVYIMGIGAVILIIVDILGKANCLNTRYNGLLFVFILSYGITSLFQHKYSFLKNIIVIMWLVISFFFFYAYDKGEKQEEVQTRISTICHIMVVTSFITGILSLFCVILKFGGTFYYKPEHMTCFGLYENRLWGYFWDPNYGSVFSSLGIVCSIASIKYFYSKKLQRAFLYTNIIIQYLYIAMAHSRTGQICLSVACFFMIFGKLYCKYRKEKNVYYILHILITGILVAVIITMMKPVRNAITNVVNTYIPFSLTEFMEEKYNTEFDTGGMDLESSISLEREDVRRDNISNGRVKIWKGDLEIWKESPLFGLGNKSYREYAVDKLPDNYVATTQKASHNDYVNMLVSSGIIGLSLVLVFMILLFKQTIIYLWNHREKPEEIVIVWGILMVICMLISCSMTLEIFMFHREWSAFTTYLCCSWLAYYTDDGQKESYLYQLYYKMKRKKTIGDFSV